MINANSNIMVSSSIEGNQTFANLHTLSQNRDRIIVSHGTKRKYNDRDDDYKTNKASRVKECFHEAVSSRRTNLQSNREEGERKHKIQENKAIQNNEKSNRKRSNAYLNEISKSAFKKHRHGEERPSDKLDKSYYIRINKQIIKSSVQAILNLLKHESNLDEVNVATAIHRIAKQPKNYRLSSNEISLLLSLVKIHFQNMKSRELTNTA